jgi:glutathione S-transferase
MKLYQDNGNFSPNAKRIRVLCYEVGAPFEIVPMDFVKGEWQRPEYLEKNPMGKVPTIEDEGYLLWESPAILFHIASKYGDRELVPRDTRGLTEMLKWLSWNASHLESNVFAVAREKLIKPLMKQEPDNAVVENATKGWLRFAPVLNAHLEDKPWVLGDFSIVDIALGASVEFATFAGLEVGAYPHLAAWLGRLTSRDSWKRASAK